MDKCPCGSGLDYAGCCEPLITRQTQAETALALMRSRYTAYATGAVEYIKDTTHPDQSKDFDERSTRSWSRKSVWTGLEVVETVKGGHGDTEGEVEFVAHYRQKDTPVRHHERAEFRRVDGTWFFFDGKPVIPETFHRETPKVGRNDPCSCGSGKKFKKCCGA
jgi:SEC-C motif-containing protein